MSAGRGCLGWLGRAAFAGLRWLHLQCVVEAIEVVEEADGTEQFHNLALRVVALQIGELFVGD